MGNTIIEIKELSKSFRNKNVLNNLSLSIPKGSVYGLLGRNGEGKTTLIKCILGFLKPSSGIVSDRECTIFFSTHITSDLERIADHVAVLKDGKIDFCGELGQLKDEVKRLRVTTQQPIPQNYNLHGLIYCESSKSEAIITVRGFKNEIKNQIEHEFKAKVEIEDLNLEEIFLELNR